MATVKEITTGMQDKMNKTCDALKVELASLRTGRASSALLDKITVDYYGMPTPVKQIASVTVPEPRMILVKPYERNMLKAVEKAILMSDLGLNPNNDGVAIRLNLPMLTQERRKELAKKVNKKAEEYRKALRNLRRDANDAIKKAEKAKEITEDEAKKGTEDVQKITDKMVKAVDKIAEAKEKEVMEI